MVPGRPTPTISRRHSQWHHSCLSCTNKLRGAGALTPADVRPLSPRQACVAGLLGAYAETVCTEAGLLSTVERFTEMPDVKKTRDPQ